MRTRRNHHASNLLLGLGVVLLGFCGLQATDAWWFQRSAARSLERARVDVGGRAVPPIIVPAAEIATIPAARVVVAADADWLGSLEVPRLPFAAMILPDDRNRSLQRGVGHIRGTAAPGDAGNCGLAGHRDTFFRKLQHVECGDTIRITTPSSIRTYRVAWMRIVEPTAVEVLAPSDSTLLTLVTCYPFDCLGSAPQRYVVRAVATSADEWKAPRTNPVLPAAEQLPGRSASWHDANSAETTTTRASN